MLMAVSEFERPLASTGAKYSYAQLVATAQDLTDAAVRRDPLLATLVKSAVDVKANRVSVVLLRTTATTVVDAILARFGGDQLIVSYTDTLFTEQAGRNAASAEPTAMTG